MQRLATLFFFLMLATGAAWAETAEAPRRPFGDGKSPIGISANSVLRWQQDGKTLLDLQGNVNLFQGNYRITSPRLLAWFSESAQAGGQAGLLEVYAENGTVLLEEGKQSAWDQPGLLRLTAAGGLVLNGVRMVSGEPPVEDPFRLRAMEKHGDTAAAAAEGGVTELLGAMHPSAERTMMTDWSDAGFTVTLLGNAAVFTDDMTLRADSLRVRVQFRTPEHGSPRMQSIFAEGSVDFRRGDIHITCDALYIDGVTDQGLAVHACVRTHEPTRHLPIQFVADSIREESLYRFTTEGEGYITTSTLADPHLKVKSSQMQVVLGSQAPREREKPAEGPAAAQPEAQAGATGAPRDVVISASDVTGSIDDIPIFYWPYIAKDIRTGSFLVKGADFGSASYFGTLVKLQWDLYDLGIYHNDWSDLALRTDAFSQRGFGYGLEFPFQDEARHGFARVYYIRDNADWDDAGLPVLQKDRGEATLRDREMLGGGWKADLELGYLSDRRFLYTYDRRSLDEDMDRQTEAFVSHVSENTMFTAQTGRQINNFQNVLEEDSVTYHVIGEPIGDTPLLWTTHTGVAEMRMRFDHATGLPTPEWVDRLDTAHEVSSPFSLGCIRAEPFVWEDLTGYSEEADNESPSLRVASAYGLRAASNFYRTYEAQSSLFEVDRLRHIITPAVEYANLYYVNRDPSHYVQNDEIDALDESHFVTFGLLNRLQTYRETDTGRKAVDLLTADVKYHVRISGNSIVSVRGDSLSANQGISPYTGDFIQASLRWNVNENIELASNDDEFNTDKSRLEALNGSVTLNYWKPLKVTYAHMYYLDPTDTAGPWHSISLITFAYQPRHSRWSVDFSETYDFLAEKQPGQLRDPRNLGSAVYLTRNMEGWDLSIGAEFNQGTGNGTVVMFRVTPPGSTPAFRSTQSPI
jgi:lipopolysaccharide export system protein LptA